ncbi:MFS general substrate transporter [Laetiporus sulphureus 93-53]|uniref:MFS general substrate transporter n=1 Tax=Laetiporus sulphureus 93-53 TaxID=1314785 RepID=A0A165IFM5_9APHY|nr:MFS general substrate transporter [Laetiporus sulphureus 93-53]KZT13006.1 MFS general substrate transporter [Laetiporus sulphureus 93-53]
MQCVDSSDEKNFAVTAEVDEVSLDDLEYKDEALRLVGMERKTNFSEEFYLKVRRKLDYTIPPLCGAVYCTQYLDKTALNYASIMGFPVTGQEYNIVAFSFYVGFVIWVFPTMYISQRTRLAKYLGVNIVLWGIVLLLHVIPNSFGPFFALRLLLGMLESCVAPTLILMISMFYKKDEQASRISWYYLMNGFSSIIGGFLAYGVSYATHASIPSYKVMYLILGSLAICVGIAVLLFMPDSPAHAMFLTREERIAAVERIRDDQGGTENKVLKKDQLIEALVDMKTWLIVLSTLLTNIPNGGLANFSNIIVKSFGYTTKQTLILSTPGGLIAVITTVLVGWWSDRSGERMLPIVFTLVPTIVGAAMLVALNGLEEKGPLLFASYIIGTYGSSLSQIYAYNASNTSGHTKKVTVNAMTLAAFCVANIVGTETFQAKDAPGYLPGKISVLTLLSAEVFLCLFMRRYNMYLRKKKEKGIAELRRANGWTDEDIERERQRHAFIDMTDKQNPYFVYTM